MRALTIALPFAALFIAALGAILSSTFGQYPWLGQAFWVTAGALMVLWGVLDYERLQKMFHRRGTRYGIGSGISVVLAILVIIGVAMLSSRPRFNKSYDVTKGKINTLSDQTFKILDKISNDKMDIKVTGFFQDDSRRNFEDLFSLYQKRAPNLNLKIVDGRTDPAEAIAQKVTTNTVIFRYGERESRVTVFTEEKLTNALVSLLKVKAKKIYFTTGRGEGDFEGADEAGFGTAVDVLKNNKYSVEKLSLLEAGKVPEDADALIIAGPHYDFREEETRILDDYVSKGGALLVMVEAIRPLPHFFKFMETYGIRYVNNLLIMRPGDPRAAMFGQMGQTWSLVSDFDAMHPVTRDFAKRSSVLVTMPQARAIEEVKDNARNMKVELVGKVSDAMISIKNVNTEDDLRGLNEKSQDRIEMGEFAVLAVATGKATQPSLAKNDPEKGGKSDALNDPQNLTHKKKTEIRIVAAGSSQFATNAMGQFSENQDMFVNIVNYLLEDEDFISIRPREAEKSTMTLATPQSQLLLLVLCFVYPFVFLGTGMMSWLRRRSA